MSTKIPVTIPGGGGVANNGLSAQNPFPLTCNLSRIDAWTTITYTGPLAKIPTFWIYQTQPQIVLTQQLAIALTLGNCKKYMQNLYNFRAGRPGPIDIQHAFKSMCTPDCLESDSLHQSLMRYTGCSCLELSTQPNQAVYTSDGDYCRENTGRLLCEMIGFCGIWECRLSDFMCPRYEFNKKIIPLKGKYGSCGKVLLAAAAPRQRDFHFRGFTVRLILTFFITLLLYWR